MNLKYAFTIATSLFLASTGTVQAQVAEVPNADSNGDFNTAIVQGPPRGFYANNWWVIVANSSGESLNCRDSPNGEIRNSFITGAILTAAFGGPVTSDDGRANYDNDAIVMHNGLPWLRVFQYGRGSWHPGLNSSPEGECYVRANLQYITPVNKEAGGIVQ
ncbi:MAG: hypothetical protein AAFW84_04255 [Cyanobacteria bacterium J06635_15]